ncbi:histidine kinase [Saccharopolyspora indica]|uniref:sensor histidine kinase n=1 Tax=Saccharopolyspora indica TaxID=1229659 RepID=UPI0022EADEDE|nr:ATP-binding protein [Saccharopolyspora indica]MDA3650213.1 histidine kinase [Saccharopolyspora indica]
MRERRAAEAITAHLGRGGRVLDPVALAQVVGSALGASGCALVIGGQRFQWRAGDSWVEQDISYGGSVCGVLAAAPESVGPVASVAAVLGAPVAMIRLARETDHARRAGDSAARALVDDRWRAAAEMEAERRGLERDLHDGAQHQLVALRMSLALAEHALSTGQGQEHVAKLMGQLDDAERVLVETAAGILPDVLAADGLAAALRTELARHGVVSLDLDGLRRRYPTPVESAVYYVVLEAVNNARKHAAGARVTVTAWDSYEGLAFAVSDDGPGFAASTGLPNLTARAASVGGVVEVRSAPGAGTTVSGVVPV